MNGITEGEQRFAEGKIQEAKDCFLSVLENDPENKEACNNLGVILFQEKEFEQAGACFQKAMSTDPFYKSGLMNFCALLKETGQLPTAIPMIRDNIDKTPDDASLKLLLREAVNDEITDLKAQVETLYEMGDYEAAFPIASELTRRLPKSAETRNDYAVLCHKLGRTAEALRAVERAVQLSPKDPAIQENYKVIVDDLNMKTPAPAHGHGEGLRENIAIFEVMYHWNYFITTVEVFKQKHNVFPIVGKAFKQTLEQKYDFDLSEFDHLVLENMNWDAVNRYLKEHNISKLFFPTIQGFEFTYHFSRANISVPFYFTIHNFDLWLGKRPVIRIEDKNAEQQVNRVYQNCCREIIQKSAGIITIDSNLKDNLDPIIRGKDIYVMPWNVNKQLVSPDNRPASKGPVVFTIPASIDRSRRNYGVALETFKALAPDHPDIKLVVLGRAVDSYGETIIEKSRRINEENGREVIETFDGYIHQDIYEDRLRRTNYFILPVANLNVFGRFKASAAMYDAMFAGRPILVPEKMYFSKAFSMKFGDGFLVYKDLLETVKGLMNATEDELAGIRKAAADNANHFFIENQVAFADSQFFGEPEKKSIVR